MIQKTGKVLVKDKIKVLWVINSFGFGGAERQALYMYDLMKRNSDFDIRFIYYAERENELDITNVNAILIDKSKVGPIGLIRSISSYIKENDIKIMHAFGGCSANIYGRAGAMFTKAIPVGALLGKGNFAPIGFKSVNSFLNLFGNYWTLNNNELIPVLKSQLLFVNKKKIFLIHNGFVSAQAINYRINEYTDYDVDKKDNFVFCTVGRLEKVKNYPLFIKAAAEIAKERSNVRFWMIGTGREENDLKALAGECGIGDRIKFWGYRTDTDVALSRIDAFVMTSYTEGSPNALAEALRAGKPIISTHSCDLSEMIKDGKNGYEIKNDSLEELTDSMRKLIALDKHEREQFGECSRELFNKNFSGENVVKEISSFYNMILKK